MSRRTRSFYLDAGEQVFALFDDRPPLDDGGAPAVGVLLCPLFGNADLCAYRARHDWAKALAAAGHPTLRIDLPGTGDSPGNPLDPGRPRAWRDALVAAAAWLRTEGGCGRVAAVGVALGGLLAYEAACAGAAIDDLVLWSVPARGRTLLRQLRALSQMEASRETADARRAASGAAATQPPANASQAGQARSGEAERSLLPAGALETAGFVLGAETVAALEALDVGALELPRARERRALLLDRDGLPVDARLQAALQDAGAEVAVAPGPGFGAMVAPPQQSKPPREVFATVIDWLRCAPASTSLPAPAPVRASSALRLAVAGRQVRETPIAIARGEQQLLGVLAEPEDPVDLCAVLLNAGALRRIGPNRMWVEAARRWAARGVVTLRIDLAGIGDSDGDAEALEQDEGFYIPRYIAQTQEVLDALRERGLPQRFVLAGLCSGAYWAFQVALQDESVRGAFMVNPRALFWDWSIGGVREARNLRKALRPATWRKLASGDIDRARVHTIAAGVRVTLASLPRRLRARSRARVQGEDELGAALKRIAGSGAELLAVFTDREPVYEELRRDGGLRRMTALRNVRVESIPGPLTSHTLEPLPLQRAVHRLLDAALERVLESSREPRAAQAPSEPASAQAQLNEQLWAGADLVSHYSDRALRPPEVMLLVRYREQLRGRVLELGCGGGRLSGYLIELASEFRGLDISARMVAHCRSAYPRGSFEQGDLRDLSRYADGSFAVVVAPFNVLDVLDDAERTRVLAEIHRMLAPEGLLIVSSHNLAFAPRILKPTQLRSRHPLRAARQIRAMPRSVRNWRRSLRLQRRDGDHAILVDEAHDYSILHYYIGRDAQERQLTETGFALLECLDLDGRLVQPGEQAASHPELHYVARRV